MKRLLNILICIIFLFVSIGGNIYTHQCEDTVFFSVYQKLNTEHCPLCVKHHSKSTSNHKSCQKKCKDSVLEIDQLADKSYNTNYPVVSNFSPAIVPILWIIDFVGIDTYTYHKKEFDSIYLIADSSPPVYLYNCIFRI